MLILARFDLVYVNFDKDLTFRFGFSPELRKKLADAEAKQEKANFLRDSRQQREAIGKKIRAIWIGDYRFSDGLVKEVRDQHSLCEFKGGRYTLDVTSYDVDRNVGVSSLQVYSRTFNFSDEVGHGSCSLDGLGDQDSGYVDSKVFGLRTFDVPFELDNSLQILSANLVQEHCTGSCLETKASFELSDSNKLVYRGRDLLLRSGVQDLTLLLNREDR